MWRFHLGCSFESHRWGHCKPQRRLSALARASVSRNTTEFYTQVFLCIHNTAKAILSTWFTRQYHYPFISHNSIMYFCWTPLFWIKTQAFPIEASQCISLLRYFPSCEFADAGPREIEQFSFPWLEQHCRETVLIRMWKCSNCFVSCCSPHHCSSETQILPVFLSNTFCTWSSDLADTF